MTTGEYVLAFIGTMLLLSVIFSILDDKEYL